MQTRHALTFVKTLANAGQANGSNADVAGEIALSELRLPVRKVGLHVLIALLWRIEQQHLLFFLFVDQLLSIVVS